MILEKANTPSVILPHGPFSQCRICKTSLAKHGEAYPQEYSPTRKVRFSIRPQWPRPAFRLIRYAFAIARRAMPLRMFGAAC